MGCWCCEFCEVTKSSKTQTKMVEVNIKNMLKLPQLFKIIELVMTFILLLLYRIPDCRLVYVNDEDALKFADLVYIGFFFICILQIFSILAGDKSPIMDILIAAFGFIFFLSIGAKVIAWCSSDAAKILVTKS